MQEVGQLGDTVVSARFVPVGLVPRPTGEYQIDSLSKQPRTPLTPVSLTTPKPHRHPPSLSLLEARVSPARRTDAA